MATDEMVMVRTRVDRSKRGSAKIADTMDFRLEHLDYPGGDTSRKPTLRIQHIFVGPEPVEVTAGEAQTLKGLSRRIEIVKERVAVPAASVMAYDPGTVVIEPQEQPEFNLGRANKAGLMEELERLEIDYELPMTNTAMRNLIEKSSADLDDVEVVVNGFDEEDDEDE